MAAPRQSPGAYSRMVGLLKIALPILAIMVLSTVFLAQTTDDFDGGLVFSKADRETLGDGLTIRDPRFAGVTKAGDQFSVAADTATPDQSEPNRIDIVNPVAQAVFADGLIVEITAAEAVADLNGQILTLAGGTRLATSDGYTVTSEGGIADLAAGTVMSTGPVVADGPTGHIEAGAVLFVGGSAGKNNRPLDNRRITFDNGVKMTIFPNAAGAPE